MNSLAIALPGTLLGSIIVLSAFEVRKPLCTSIMPEENSRELARNVTSRAHSLAAAFAFGNGYYLACIGTRLTIGIILAATLGYLVGRRWGSWRAQRVRAVDPSSDQLGGFCEHRRLTALAMRSCGVDARIGIISPLPVWADASIAVLLHALGFGLGFLLLWMVSGTTT